MRVESHRSQRFDAICAGETIWNGLVPGGAISVAQALAQGGLQVGLASVLVDDTYGRKARDEVAASGIDVGGVTMTPPRELLFFGGRSSASPPFEIPADWTTDLMVLSGLSPNVAHAAALCKAARAARRAGALVVLDFNARLHTWAGREPRTVRMILREVDVARCSIADTAVLGMDLTDVQAALRPSAVLVTSDAVGRTVAMGPFGEVSMPRARRRKRGDVFTAGICTALIRRGERGESAEAMWQRALRQAS